MSMPTTGPGANAPWSLLGHADLAISEASSKGIDSSSTQFLPARSHLNPDQGILLPVAASLTGVFDSSDGSDRSADG